MTYKKFNKIQIYTLIQITILIFFSNYQLIYNTRNILETDQNFLPRLIFVEKNPKTESNPNIDTQKRLFVSSDHANEAQYGEYIKDKQNISSSNWKVKVDKARAVKKRLINSLYKLFYNLWLSVKDRYLLGQNILRQSRDSFLEDLEELHGSRSVPLAKGLLFGDVSGISQDVYHSFKVIGILHILSASSANFSIFLHFGLLFFLPVLPVLSKKFHFSLYSCLIFIYFTLVGPAASTTRAFITLNLGYYINLVLKRSFLSIYNLYLAGIIILYINPIYLTTLGFQFSFLASFGILFLYDKLQEEPWIAKNSIVKNLILTFCAQFFLLPVMLYSFGELNYLSFFANIFILPLVELLTLTFLASFVIVSAKNVTGFTFLDPFVSQLSTITMEILYKLIDVMEKIPWKTWTIANNKDRYVILILAINIVIAVLVVRDNRKRYKKNQYRIFK